MDRLTTESLLLDPLTRDDYTWLYALYADAQVMRFIGTGVRSEAVARKNLDWLLAHGEEKGFGYWVLRDRKTGERVGGGILMIRRPGETVELGFALAKSAWGRGFATQTARALIDHAFGALAIPELQAFIDPLNEASGSVLRKAGMQDAGLATGPYGTLDRRFVLGREAWLAAR